MTGPEAAAGPPSPRWRRDWLGGCLLFLFALALRWIYLYEIRGLTHFLLLDSEFYYEWAERILAGEWIGSGALYQSPLYAYFLALILGAFRGLARVLAWLHVPFDPLFGARALQAALGAAGCLLILRIARRVAGAPAGWVAGILAAVYGPFLYYDTMIMKTFLAVLLSLLCLLLLDRSGGIRPGALLAAGVLYGLTSLVRDNFVLMLPFLLAGLLPALPRPRWRPAARASGWILAGAAVVILPVTVRNFAAGRFCAAGNVNAGNGCRADSDCHLSSHGDGLGDCDGEFTLLTAGGGEVFYIGNNPEADGRYRPPCVPVRGSVQCVRADPRHEHDDFRQIASALAGRTLTPMEGSRFWFRRGLDFILRHPLRWARLEAQKLVIFFQDREIGDNYDFDMFRRISRVLRPLPSLGDVASLALVGIVCSWPGRRRFALLYAFGCGYLATLLLFFHFSRFRMPAVPVLIVFAAVALVWLFRQAREVARAIARGGFPAAIRSAAILFLALAAVAAGWTLSHRRGPTTILLTLQQQVHLGDLLRETGRPAQAVREYDTAMYLVGDAPIEERLDLLGGTPVETFRTTLQEERLAHGLNFRIVHGRLYEGRGLAYRETGDLRRASADLEESVRIFLDGSSTLLRLAEVYEAMGDLPAAGRTLDRALREEEIFSARFDLAGILFRVGNPQAALQILAGAPERNPEMSPGELADYHFGMGLILLQALNRPEEARRHLESCLRLAPDHPQAQRIREEIAAMPAPASP
ncbi:MAG: glycosyltransferase family 39 protein [Acidobacteria bacterium]|nr:glycosyltransferase family 39 protein [Acidobacteriota bacterium]